jgi:hypothetical protein
MQYRRRSPWRNPTNHQGPDRVIFDDLKPGEGFLVNPNDRKYREPAGAAAPGRKPKSKSLVARPPRMGGIPADITGNSTGAD